MKQYLRAFCVYLQNDWTRWFFLINFVARNHYFVNIDCSSFFVNIEYYSRMSIESFKEFETKFSKINKKRRQRLNVDFYVERINQINQKLRVQIIYVQVYQKKYVNRHREHVSKRQIKNKIWLNTRNMKSRRSIKKFFNFKKKILKIIKILNFHVYRFKLSNNWKIHNVFHIFFLKNDFHDSLSRQIVFESLFISQNRHDQNFWKIIKINDSQTRAKKLKYLVIWRNDENDWILVEDCINLDEFFDEYH